MHKNPHFSRGTLWACCKGTSSEVEKLPLTYQGAKTALNFKASDWRGRRSLFASLLYAAPARAGLGLVNLFQASMEEVGADIFTCARMSPISS